jgi:hypothetical protein
MTSIGEPVGSKALTCPWEAELSLPGSTAGLPVEDYDGERDAWESVSEAYRVIRARMAAGGQGWEPKGLRDV